MTNNLTLSAWLLFLCVVTATEIAVPSTSEMISSSDAVAVAQLIRKDEGWTITINEVLKGSYHSGEVIKVSSPYNEEAFSFDYLARMVGNGEFMFVGKQPTSERVLEVTYGLSSFWPQGRSHVPNAERTLGDSIAFAKKTLGLSSPTSGKASANPSYDQSKSRTKVSELVNPSTLQTHPLPEVKYSLQPKVSKPTSVVSSEEPTSSTLWSIIVVLIVAACGLLWLLLNGRK